MTWSLTGGSIYSAMTGVLLAWMAGIQEGRGREFGHQIASEGRRGGVERLQGHHYFHHPAD